MTFGITPSGFTAKRLVDARAELEARFKAEFGEGIRTGATSIIGKLIAVFANVEANLWELAQSAYWSIDPDQASGVLLDNLARIIGLTRLAATFSTVTLTITGDEGTIIPAGSAVSQIGTGDRFVTLEEVEIPSPGTIAVGARAEVAGPILASSGTLTVIESPVAGWDSVTNAADASPGRAEEVDSALRLRMRTSLQISGSATVNALRARILEADGVEAALVIENTNTTTNADGLPGKSFEAVVLGGNAEDLGRLIFDHKAAGIKATSTASTAPARVEIVVTDSQGEDHEIAFTRPQELAVHMRIAVSATRTLAGHELDAIKAGALALGQRLSIGDDVVLFRFKCLADDVQGATDVTVFVGLSSPPTSTSNLAVTRRQIARLDSSRLDVVQT
jgi:uncharacterized phage protein gp47/JayE